jgi:exosortase/archaeosortase family protein
VKTLLAFVSFGVFFAYMLNGRKMMRIALALMSLPLAIAVNVMRISMIGATGESFGEHAATMAHDYGGVLWALVGISVLYFVARLTGCRKFAGVELF